MHTIRVMCLHTTPFGSCMIPNMVKIVCDILLAYMHAHRALCMHNTLCECITSIMLGSQYDKSCMHTKHYAICMIV